MLTDRPYCVACRKPVPTDKRIAIALYKLATCAEYRVVGETFGVSKTTVHICVMQYALPSVNKPNNIQSYPTLARRKRLLTATTLQALVDDKLIFRDLCVGTPGSAHDAVFISS